VLFMIVLLLLAFSIIIMIEAPGLVKKKMWRELAAFSVLMIIGMILAVPQIYGVRLVNPNAPWIALFKPIMEIMEKP